MPNVLGSLPVLRKSLADYVENPMVVNHRTLSFVHSVYKGEMDYVDCSNPAILLMESSALLASSNIEHTNAALSKQYPLLANTVEDLYLHMNDTDYHNRFSIPATGTFRVMIQYDTFTNVSIPDPSGFFKSVSIPMDTQVTVGDDNYTFDHELSVQIYKNHTVRIVVTKSKESSVRVTDQIISNRVISDADGVKFVVFDIPLRQITKTKQYYDIPNSVAFQHKLRFENDFYKVKVYSVSETNVLSRLKTTHSKQITDPYDPTVVIQVNENDIDLFIPPIYTLSGTLGKELLVILYTTLGEIDHNYNSVPIEENKIKTRDLLAEPTDRADAFGQTSHRIYPTRAVRGGRNSLSFPELRERMINNNIGINHIPITPNNLGITLEDYGYTHLKYIDTLSGRTYIVSSKQPVGTELPFKGEVGVSYIDLKTTLSELKLVPGVFNNIDQVTIGSEVVYQLGVGGVSILPSTVVSNINTLPINAQASLVNEVGDSYRYSPFHYVVDYKNGQVKLRPYRLNSPITKEVNFINRNNTVPLFISTGAIEINLTPQGYTLTLQTRIDETLSTMPESEFMAQLSFMYKNKRIHLLPHTIDKNSKGQFTVSFILGSTLEINENHEFNITTGVEGLSYLGVDSTVDVLYGTRRSYAEYTSSDMDAMVYLPPGGGQRYPVSHERVSITWGTYLEHLWKDSRALSKQTVYATYDEDVALTHSETNILVDHNRPVPFTIENGCEVKFVEATVKDEVVTDGSGNIVLAHRKGDYILGGDGLPIPINSDYERVSLTLLVYSGLFYWAKDPTVLNHIGVVSENITYQSTIGIKPLIDMALEHTHMLYKPQDTIGLAEIEPITGEQLWIDKPQDLTVTLTVKKAIIDSEEAKGLLKDTTVDTLIDLLSRRIVSYAHITSILTHTYGDGILGVKVDGLGGLNDGRSTMTLVDDNDRLSLAKEVFVNNEERLSVRNKIVVNYEEEK